jgi:hypothetical protein
MMLKVLAVAALALASVPASAATWWQPTSAVPWQWELSHPLRLGNATDMGTGRRGVNGQPAANPVMYDIDGFENPASTVTALHTMGKKVVCYIEVGAAENYRPDYSSFPAATLGNTMPGYPSERYIDIRAAAVVSIIEARIKMCADKGFDAIEPDIDESYGSPTGFPLTQADEEAYMTTLANYAHGLGLAMFGKDISDTDDSYAQDMLGVFDAVLTESCNEYDECTSLLGYKAVFDAEYDMTRPRFCPLDAPRPGWNGIRFPYSLNGPRSPCN